MSKKLWDIEGMQAVLFFCPGCQCGHKVTVAGDVQPVWSWNNSYESPTFSPSVLVGSDFTFTERRCHSFVNNGEIQFLSDCYHDLAGKTVPLPDV